MHITDNPAVPCTVCGKGKVVGNDGTMPRFVDFERDLDWSDPLMVCEDCVARAGGLVGMASKDSLVELRRVIQDKDKEIHELQADKDSMKRRAKRIGFEFTDREKVA